jgi:hypothetical protein
MTLKKNLENRIRGWYPQGPNITKSSVKQDFQVNQQGLSLSKKIDRIGWILIITSLFFFLFYLGSIILRFSGSSIYLMIGFVFIIVFNLYNQRRVNRMKNKQNTSEIRS